MTTITNLKLATENPYEMRDLILDYIEVASDDELPGLTAALRSILHADATAAEEVVANIKRRGSVVSELAKVLGLDEDEFEIYRDYQAHGAQDGDRLMEIVKREARRRRMGKPPISGDLVKAVMEAVKGDPS